MLIEFLKRIYRKFNVDSVHNAEYKRMTIAEQKQYLKKFKEPKDDYERSFFKFQCFCEYCYYQRKWLLLAYNLGAMVAYPVIFRGLKKRGANKQKTELPCDAVVQNVEWLRNYDVIPEVLIDSFKTVKEIEKIEFGKAYLSANAIDICKQLRKRYFWQFYFRMIVTMKLAQFNHYLYDYNPKKIVFYSCEREFSSPLQTMLCEKEGSEYVSFMHGDYLYTLCMAFQKYSHYYTWDEAYNEMFRELRCDFPMTVYQPRKLRGIAQKLDERECEYFATYYFSAETKESAEIIHSVLKKFEEKGLRCKVRSHPRSDNLGILKEMFSDMTFEDPYAVTLGESITSAVYAIALNSTVLSQAYFSEKQVVIDDLSMREEYLDLKEKEYIMLNRPHILLTDLIQSVDNGECYDATYKCCLE